MDVSLNVFRNGAFYLAFGQGEGVKARWIGSWGETRKSGSMSMSCHSNLVFGVYFCVVGRGERLSSQNQPEISSSTLVQKESNANIIFVVHGINPN